jgi:hypothetical protein
LLVVFVCRESAKWLSSSGVSGVPLDRSVSPQNRPGRSIRPYPKVQNPNRSPPSHTDEEKHDPVQAATETRVPLPKGAPPRLHLLPHHPPVALFCCEALGMFFGSILPEIWIFSLGRSSGPKSTANSSREGIGFWLIQNIGTLVTKRRRSAFDFNNSSQGASIFS